MGVVRTQIPAAHCLDQVQCGDVITAVGYNKLVESIANLQQIGTNGCELSARLINNYLRPAHGWSQGQVAILNSGTAGTYQVQTSQGLPFFADTNRFTLCFDARLLNNVTIGGIGPRAVRHTMEVSIVAQGYGGATQTIAEVILPGTPTSPVSFTQTGGTLAAPGGAIFREVDGAWNVNMLPPTGTMWQGQLYVNLNITKSTVAPMLLYNVANIQIPGLLDWFGVRQLQLRHYRKC